MNVMIVDDKAKVRTMIRGLLEGGLSGVEHIYECADGHEAVIAYENHHPDWVLMDIEMEPMDGLTASRIVLTADPLAKVIIVTSYGDARYREAAHAAGVHAYVLKENLRDILGIITKSSSAPA